jgi:hypothetical protein
LIALVLAVGLTGTVVAMDMHGVLVYISYRLVLPPPPSYVAIPVYVNLGNHQRHCPSLRQLHRLLQDRAAR